MNKQTLEKCRYAALEFESIKVAMEHVGSMFPDCRAEERRKAVERFYSKQRKMVDAINEAEQVIESVEHTGARTALRQYYINAVRTWDEVANLCYCDTRTVRRWVQNAEM